ncbi:MAG: hypothetical protein G01um101419_217 [Parcubacteria group bacterium Gr01-1014_19]|nr:MAG: hypothetical protein G01um101419_217 [Parcubacteria group bacterium Gr01-1014_19]
MEPVTLRQKIPALVAFWVIQALTYFLIPMKFAFEPTLVSYTRIDQAIPFVLWTIVVYATFYAQVSLMFLLAESRKALREIFAVYFWGGCLLSAFYFLMPTVHDYPVPVQGCCGVLEWIFLKIRHIDVAANQFPSGHTLLSLIGPFYMLASGRKMKGWLFLIWGLAITASTLTVKQHNAYDAVAGISFAWVFGYVFGRYFSKPAVQPVVSK